MASHDDVEPRSRAGELLAGKYRLGLRLAAGGMGEVYSAEHTVIGRMVAIKLLLREHAENPTLAARFLTEARAANIVRHPNVVDVLDIGQADDGTPFIVQELLDGQDLAHRLVDLGGRMPFDEAMRVLIPVVEAVGTAHEKGVVHRDMKPENVFLARVGSGLVPKLLDFGISHVRRESSDVRLTSSGVGMGTPAYMSPEQVMSTRDSDARTDVWALGVILYEVLGGVLPFSAETHSGVFVQIATVEPPPLQAIAPDLPRDVYRIVDRCLRKNRDERYPSAKELAVDLRAVTAGQKLGVHETAIFAAAAQPQRGKDLAIAATLHATPKGPRELDFGAPSNSFEATPLGGPGMAGPDNLGGALDLGAAPDPIDSGLRLASYNPPRPEAQDSKGSLDGVFSMPRTASPARAQAAKRPAASDGSSIPRAVTMAGLALAAGAGAAFVAPKPAGWPFREIIADNLAGLSSSLIAGAASIVALLFVAFAFVAGRRAWLLWGDERKAGAIALDAVAALGVALAIQLVRAVA